MSQEPKVTRFGALPTVDAELATKAYVDSGGGGGAAGQTFARIVKKVDESVTSSTTLQDDDELFIPLLANKTYFGTVYIWQDAPVTPDIKSAFSIPAGASGNWMGINALFRMLNQPTVSITTSINGTGSINPETFANYFRVIMAGTAGNLQFQWAQRVSDAAATTVEQGSSLIVWEEIE